MGGGIYAHGSESIYKSSFVLRGSKCKEVMCKAFARGSPTAATWISSRALFLSLLVVCVSIDPQNDDSEENIELPTLSVGASGSGVLKATARSCQVPCIDTGKNVFVAKTCSCSVNRGDDANYYSDESYEDEDAFEISARSAEATTKTEVEAYDMSSTSGNESVVQPTNSPVPTETTTLGGIIAENGSVADGTPCLSFIKSNGEDGDSIAVGACYNRKCNGSNPTIYKLPRTVPNPYIYHCQVNTTSINTKLQVAVGCIASCYDSTNRTWNETRLNDGRLCALPKESNNSKYVNRTGVCRNGTCVTADFTPWTHPNGCVDATTRRNGRVLAVRCTDYCKDNTTQELPDGTPCLLNHERKVHVPTVSDLIVEGICKNGHCIITPPAIPVAMVNIPEEGCEKFVSSVSYTEKVDATCSFWCPGKKTKPVKRGTECALETTGRWWSRVTEVGQCLDQTCIDKAPDSPPPHKLNSSEYFNCKTIDYLTVIPARLIVAASCQVECGYTVFEHRADGVKCLLEYSRTPGNKKSKEGTGVYRVGVCKNGYCTVGKHSMNISTTD
uniref:Evasin n=1 Tax=Rhipicephalus zambeziensis TaxID=60191 RepID=A0A224Y3E8_9ACAR